jgi:ETC complex I subunit conserved region
MSVARIYKPARTAMQSGTAKTKAWVLDYEPAEPRAVEPLMGWTSSGDMRQQLHLRFHTKEEAIAYCEREGIAYQVSEPKPQTRHGLSYADNFATARRTPWTH